METIWNKLFIVYLKFMELYKRIINYKVKQLTEQHIYQLSETYRSDTTGQHIIIGKILGSPRGAFKIPASELVMQKRDILMGFPINDIINIVGLALSDGKPIITHTKVAEHKLYPILASLFVISLVTSNVCATKLVSIFGYTMAGGFFIFPLCFIFGDIITEVYGYKKARQLIWSAMLCNFVFCEVCSGMSSYCNLLDRSTDYSDTLIYV